MTTLARRSLWRRRIAGFLWLTGWIGLLYAVAAPWRSLGGLVDERLRWLEWFVLFTGLPLGFTLGRFARDLASAGGAHAYLGLLRFLLYPPLLLTAVSMVLLTFYGERGISGVVLTALLAYWAGLDIAFGAVPLMEGRSFRLTRPLDPDDSPRSLDARATWVPPWDRF